MTTQSRQVFITKSRHLADQLIKVFDSFNALVAEADISQLMLPAEYGGLGDVVGHILQPLTMEQKRIIYTVRQVPDQPGLLL